MRDSGQPLGPNPLDLDGSRLHITARVFDVQQDTFFLEGRFRDFLGIGRNLSIEILECFDKIGYTQRFKSGRIIKKTAEEIIKGYSYS